MDRRELDRKVWPVGELAHRIRFLLEDQIGKIWVEGEVSNVRAPASGHIYFTLKDEKGQIAAVWFLGARRTGTLELRDGMKVRVFGLISAYVKGSSYQIIVEQVEEAGKGSLHEAFEKLKAKLKAEGLFDRPKKTLPLLPQHIGIVTSATGAAIRDILKVLTRRFPNLHVLLVPVRVQGEGAAQEIAAALDLLNQRGGLDVIIVGRGGGSLEDLWCFNEEVVARAIARSSIPVISAVGHETDFTISDFVADVRAPTPSAAAEMVVRRKDEFRERVMNYDKSLRRALRNYADVLESRCKAAKSSSMFRAPRNILQQYTQQLDHVQEQLAAQLSKRIESIGARTGTAGVRLRPYLLQTVERAARRLDSASVRINHAVIQRHRMGQDRLAGFETQLRTLHPRRVMERGYSITRSGDGVIVRSVQQVQAGDRLVTELFDGRIESEVAKTMQEGDGHGGEAKKTK